MKIVQVVLQNHPQVHHNFLLFVYVILVFVVVAAAANKNDVLDFSFKKKIRESILLENYLQLFFVCEKLLLFLLKHRQIRISIVEIFLYRIKCEMMLA